MIPTQTLSEFPVFGNSSTKVQPDDAKYSAGFVNADVMPYEWVNWLHNKASAGITDLNAGMASAEAELNAVVEAGGATPSSSDNTQVVTAIKYLIAAAKSEAILAAHPVGSLFWSSVATSPATLFGGTWTRIKDKFILAAGDTYTTVGATGGAATVTLAVANLPSHNHTFTGSAVTSGGSSAANTGSESSHTHSVGAHSHGLNSHTHSFTPSGTVSSTFTGSSATTGNESAHESYSWTGSHHHGVLVYTGKNRTGIDNMYAPNTDSTNTGVYWCLAGNATANINDLADSTSSWTTMSSYTNSSGYGYYANWGARDSGTPREIVKSSSITVSGTCTGDHTHSVTAKGSVSSSFTGTAGTTGAASGSTANSTAFTSGAGSSHSHTMAHTHSVTAAGTISSTGSGTAFSILPPYVVKYCWERTA